ncbi:hypothetical protein ACEPAI_8228 [Sanghuangporus weigelae]
MSSAKLPLPPLVTGDRLLEIFSHMLLQNEVIADNQSLFEMGWTALDLATTMYILSKKPMVAPDEIPTFRSVILSDENFEAWVAHYGLRQQLHNLQEINTANAEVDAKHIFQAYIGAVAAQAGIDVATSWTIELMSSQDMTLPVAPAGNRPRAEPATVEDFDMEQGRNTVDIVQEVKNFLEEVNKRCGQEHLCVKYQAENHASQHTPLWVVICIINGVVKGEGQGSSKRIAKEAAAKQAYAAMGWAA